MLAMYNFAYSLILVRSFNISIVAPEGTLQPMGPFYGLAGNEITITAYLLIGGNPFPSSVWTSTSGDISGDRFDTSVAGQLSISSLVVSDTGNYTNTLTNDVAGTPASIANTIEVIVAGQLTFFTCAIVFLAFLH